MDSTVLNGLAAALRTYLESQFTTGSDEVLAFEAFGIPVDPNTFRSGPEGAFNPVLVSGHLTRLTNKVGQIVGGQFHPNWNANELLAVLLGAMVNDPDLVSAFGSVKSPAEEAFMAAKPTYPTVAMPDDWYDTSVSTNWTTGHSVSSANAPAPLPPGAMPVSSASATAPAQTDDGPEVQPDRWELRIAQAPDRATLEALAQPETMMAVSPATAGDMDSQGAASAGTATDQPAPPAVDMSRAMDSVTLVNTEALETVGRQQMAVTARQPLPISEIALTDRIQASPALSMVDSIDTSAPAQAATPAPAYSMNIASDAGLRMKAFPVSDTETAPASAARIPVSEIMVNPDIMRAVLTEVNSNATEQPVDASSLTLSFDLCPVSIDRAWWSWTLVRTPGWTLPMWPGVGQLIPGLPSEQAPTPPPCGLPSTMLLVKNVQISGWSQTDLASLAQASSLGPFSFVGGTEVQNATLTAPGMQVIGWVCECLPALPPMAAQVSGSGSSTQSGT